MRRNVARGNGVWPWLALAVCLAAAGAAASCGGDDGEGDGPGDGGASAVSGLDITPRDESLTVDPEDTLPTLDFRVTSHGEPQDAAWTVDRPDLADIDADGSFTPTGRGAGVVTVTADVDGATISTTVTITIDTVQNGPGASTPGAEPEVGTPADFEPGPGGFMGIGGEGIGGKIDSELVEVLEGNPESDDSMEFLYP